MIGIKRHIILLVFMLVTLILFSQEQKEGTGDELLRHEWDAGGLLHIDGFGISGRNVRSITYYRKWFYEADIVIMKHPKEVKTSNAYYPNTKSFIYGKKNSFFVTRLGIGMQRLLNREPFWGKGLEVRMIYSVGTSLGFTKPVYLYIITDRPGYSSSMSYKLEKYNPDKHGIWDIQGRGPITKGFGELGFYPGAYGKFAFNFEFAQERSKIRALEAGTVLDLYPDKIPIMAKNENKQLFLSFYISFYFGGRYN